MITKKTTITITITAPDEDTIQSERECAIDEIARLIHNDNTAGYISRDIGEDSELDGFVIGTFDTETIYE
jgi:hypothetical protein